jgi:integral membrane protein
MFNYKLKTLIGQLRLVGFIEGCSFLLLGLTMILKYQYAMPKPNYIVGMVHGFLFVAYVILVFIASMKYRFTLTEILLSLVAATLPFATFIVDKTIFRKYDTETAE